MSYQINHFQTSKKLLLLKSYHWMDLGVFLRDTLPKKSKLNEFGILNLDSSSGDGTHWVMWFKKGKEKFNFDSYGVQLTSELITYLKSPIFYNSERVQQNG